MKRRRCKTCRRKPARKKGLNCECCNKRAWRKRNPFKSAFAVCRDKAKQRISAHWPEGIPWEITLAEFTRFAKKSQYLTRKGNEAGSITIDRKDHTKGYVRGNIQPMTRAKNVEKQAREQKHRFEAGYSWMSRY